MLYAKHYLIKCGQISLLGLLLGGLFFAPGVSTDIDQAFAEQSGAEKKTEAKVEEEEIELAPYMGNLQRFSDKLGYSLEARNQKLSEFYLEEIAEVISELDEIKEHDGMPVSQPIQIIVKPLLAALEKAVRKQPSTDEQWSKTWKNYEALVNGCNRCHSSLEHEFIVITPARGKPPYSQEFAPSGTPKSPVTSFPKTIRAPYKN